MDNINNSQNISSQRFDIFNISAKEFSDFFYNEFLPLIDDLRSKKLKEFEKRQKSFPLTLIFVFIFILYNSHWYYMSIIFLLFIIIIWTFVKDIPKRNIFNAIDIKETFFPFFGVRYRKYFQENYSDIRKTASTSQGRETLSHFQKVIQRMLVLIPVCKLDDSLTFNYHDMPVDIIELNHVHNFKSFLLVSYKTNKKFKGETIIHSLSTLQMPISNKKQPVLLEDPVFNENFKVLADDQVEARYLLTPSFMSRLLAFQKKHHCTADVLFSNNVSPDKSNVFLRITSDKDFFEIPKEEYWRKNSDYFYNILQEIKEITEILDALKLDQDIGL